MNEKCQTEREMENQNVSIKVLREENRNIEKVLTDQINQRKTIIEELVNEKNKLYSKLHHERWMMLFLMIMQFIWNTH